MQTARKHPRGRATIVTAMAATMTAFGWALPTLHGRAVTPSPITIVTVGFDDGTVDQFGVLPELQAHQMHATFFINSGPIQAGDPDHMSVEQLTELAAAGNEIGGHTVDHANIQPLPPAEATHEVCDDRATLTGWGFTVTSFAYPFGSYDATSEAIVASCGYDSARTVSGVSIHVGKDKLGETVPPADPYATRTPPNPKKATKLSTMTAYVQNAEDAVAASGQSLWIQFVFHRYCDAHCGAYTIQPAKFKALLDFLQAETTAGRVSVQTTAQVISG
jgi:peptidoglycan/xylan/chitin deacetylase (PgdA/CDA1 family)